jgi:hypothetical protein
MAQPVARFRAGSVSCAVWENEVSVNGTKKTLLKANVSRRYKDESGEWKSSQSFSRNEIALAAYVLGRAFAKIVELEQSTQNAESAEDSVAVQEEFVE